mmetsp:Transcript_42894/g.135347  ORF Transcript_42894/g.135347 Transcript_42894/m.135347 type:complete len:379 (+) Transcript_42894:70-1206(+)
MKETLPGCSLVILCFLVGLLGVALGEDRCEFKDRYPLQYVAYKTSKAPIVDGRLDDKAWQEVGWSESFQDITGDSSKTPYHETRMKMRWDDEFLYIGAVLTEPDIWANITTDNQVIFHDNDFEFFIDPAGSTHFYKEFEVNAAGAQWSLCLNKPYLNGGYENSSRVFPGHGWSFSSHLQSAIFISGTLNNPKDVDDYWSVELAVPLGEVQYNNSAGKVTSGSLWRINFSRVQWHVVKVGDHYEKVAGPEENWVWSKMGEVNMHLPERWGYLQFADGKVNSTKVKPDSQWTLRCVCMALYTAQLRYKDVHGQYTNLVEELLPFDPDAVLPGTCSSYPDIKLTKNGGYVAMVTSKSGDMLATIRDDRFLQVVPASPLERL